MSDPTNPEAVVAYWQQRVNTWRDANDLPYHRFVYWRKKFEADTPRRTKTRGRDGFTAVVREAAIDTGLTLSLPDGLVVRGICAANVAVVCALLDQFR